MGAVAEPEVTASQDRGALAKMVMTLLDHRKLSTEDQAALLGIAATNRAALSKYRSGKPIGTSRDQYECVGHLGQENCPPSPGVLWQHFMTSQFGP